jgi:hypothetical protein
MGHTHGNHLWNALGAAALAAACTAPALAADVGVSISVSQPGVYGRVDIGRFPQPQLIVQQPIVVQAAPRRGQPVYMWVPPGHRKHWRDHCAAYRACGVPVYFVRDDWYHQHVDRPGRGGGHGGERGERGEGPGHDHGRNGHHRRD